MEKEYALTPIFNVEMVNKENGVSECLKVALEMSARGIKVAPYDLYKSKSMIFTVLDDKTFVLLFNS